jgi:hypothetical protein
MIPSEVAGDPVEIDLTGGHIQEQCGPRERGDDCLVCPRETSACPLIPYEEPVMIVVRYQPKPARADENQDLVEAVFAELADTAPDGIRYATLRLADGTFVHIADVDGENNPLQASDAFAEFQKEIGDRCEEGDGPNPQEATVVGIYGFDI